MWRSLGSGVGWSCPWEPFGWMDTMPASVPISLMSVSADEVGVGWGEVGATGLRSGASGCQERTHEHICNNPRLLGRGGAELGQGSAVSSTF